MKRQIPLIAATILLTLLIWVYADLATHERIEIRLPVRLVAPPGSGQIVRIQEPGAFALEPDGPPDTLHVGVTLSGSKSAITELRRAMRREPLEPIEVVVPAGAEEFDRPLLHFADIREPINNWARLRSLLVTEEINPSAIRYVVDRYVTIELDVVVSAGAQRDVLKSEPRVDPARVRARLLASQRERFAAAETQLYVSIEHLLNATSAEEFEVSLADVRWQGLKLDYTPDRVTVTVERRHDYTRHRITAIPLHELWPAHRPEGRFRVEWEDGTPPLQHIEVMVPPGKPRLPTNQDVTAYVRIEWEDLEEAVPADEVAETAPAGARSRISREIMLVFSDEFKDVHVPGPLPTVRFRVVREPPLPDAP